jgi:hypothetical protein
LRQIGKPPGTRARNAGKKARWNVEQSVAEIITAWDALANDLEDIQVELPEIEIPVA